MMIKLIIYKHLYAVQLTRQVLYKVGAGYKCQTSDRSAMSVKCHSLRLNALAPSSRTPPEADTTKWVGCTRRASFKMILSDHVPPNMPHINIDSEENCTPFYGKWLPTKYNFCNARFYIQHKVDDPLIAFKELAYIQTVCWGNRIRNVCNKTSKAFYKIVPFF